jgi:hypothetical protein
MLKIAIIRGQNSGLDMSEIDRQKHTDRVLAAIGDFHKDHKRRTRRVVKPRRNLPGRFGERLGGAGRAKGSRGYIRQGYFGKCNKNGLFLEVLRQRKEFSDFVKIIVDRRQ